MTLLSWHTEVERCVLMFASGLAGTAVAGGGLYIFAQSDWFFDATFPPAPAVWYGYNKGQFANLVLFTFLAPISFALVFSALQYALRHAAMRSAYAHVGALLAAVCVLAAGIVFGLYWSADFLQCMGVGCVNDGKLRPYDPPQPEAIIGFKNVTGMTFLLFALGLLIALFFSFAHRRVSITEYTLLDTEPFLTAVAPSYSESLLRLWRKYFLYAAFFLAFAFTTTYIPNNWEYFSADRIAQFAHQRVDTSADGDLCGSFSCFFPKCTLPAYMCPEVSWAYFKTSTYDLADYWVLKFFPSNVMFYVFFFSLSFLALLVRSVGVVRYHMSRGLFVRPLNMYVSLGELLVLLSISTLVICWSYYWVKDHNYNGYWPGPPRFDSEIISRACGQLAVLMMSLMMFPVARDSIVTELFGVSWEAGITYHRWLGVAFLLAALAHMIGNYMWYSDNGDWPRDALVVPQSLQTSVDNFTVPLVSLALWFSMVGIGVFAVIERFRRLHFELFYYMHYVSYTTLIIAVLWHAQAAWEFLLPGLSLWFLDRCVRAYRSSKAVTVRNITAIHCQAAGNVTEIRCTRPFPYYPGQYCFINIPSISLLEWHPFTISSASTYEVTFHIKDMGPRTFTGRLYQAAQLQTPLTVSLDGPYGMPIDFSQYTKVLLVAGGIGVTPVKSIFESLRGQPVSYLRCVHLLWVVRDASLLRLMEGSLQDLPATAGMTTFNSSLYIDNPASALDAASLGLPMGCPPNTQIGRPNFSLALKGVVGAEPPSNVLLFVCGPGGISAACEALAQAEGWNFHTETFAL